MNFIHDVAAIRAEAHNGHTDIHVFQPCGGNVCITLFGYTGALAFEGNPNPAYQASAISIAHHGVEDAVVRPGATPGSKVVQLLPCRTEYVFIPAKKGDRL